MKVREKFSLRLGWQRLGRDSFLGDRIEIPGEETAGERGERRLESRVNRCGFWGEDIGRGDAEAPGCRSPFALVLCSRLFTHSGSQQTPSLCKGVTKGVTSVTSRIENLKKFWSCYGKAVWAGAGRTGLLD